MQVSSQSWPSSDTQPSSKLVSNPISIVVLSKRYLQSFATKHYHRTPDIDDATSWESIGHITSGLAHLYDAVNAFQYTCRYDRRWALPIVRAAMEQSLRVAWAAMHAPQGHLRLNEYWFKGITDHAPSVDAVFGTNTRSFWEEASPFGARCAVSLDRNGDNAECKLAVPGKLSQILDAIHSYNSTYNVSKSLISKYESKICHDYLHNFSHGNMVAMGHYALATNFMMIASYAIAMSVEAICRAAVWSSVEDQQGVIDAMNAEVFENVDMVSIGTLVSGVS